MPTELSNCIKRTEYDSRPGEKQNVLFVIWRYYFTAQLPFVTSRLYSVLSVGDRLSSQRWQQIVVR